MSAAQDRSVLRWIMMGLALTGLWALYLTWFGPRSGQGGNPDLVGTSLSEPAPFAWQLHDLQGKTVALGDYRGRPILLNFWATWCPPCRAEMPSLARLAEDQRIKAKNVAVLCVSVDDSPATVQQFLSSKAWGMTMLHTEGVPRVFQTEGIPATFLIDPAGKIVAHRIGSAEWDDPSVIDLLTQLAPRG